MATRKHLDAGSFGDPEKVVIGDEFESVRPSPYEVPTSLEISTDDATDTFDLIYAYSGAPKESMRKVDVQPGIVAWIGQNSGRLYEIRIADHAKLAADGRQLKVLIDAAVDFLLNQKDLQKRTRDNYRIARKAFDQVAAG